MMNGPARRARARAAPCAPASISLMLKFPQKREGCSFARMLNGAVRGNGERERGERERERSFARMMNGQGHITTMWATGVSRKHKIAEKPARKNALVWLDLGTI